MASSYLLKLLCLSFISRSVADIVLQLDFMKGQGAFFFFCGWLNALYGIKTILYDLQLQGAHYKCTQQIIKDP